MRSEELVINHLQKLGYYLIKHRYKKNGFGEIDIIAALPAEKQLVFIEVKARRTHTSRKEDLLDSLIRPQQLQRIRQAAEIFISDSANSSIIENWSLRFDFVIVIKNKIWCWLHNIDI